VGKLNIETSEHGTVLVSGEITFSTVNEGLAFDLLSGKKTVKINLEGVTRADSSGLALMVHWLREAKKEQVDLTFEAIPEKLFALAKVSNLDSILPVA